MKNDALYSHVVRHLQSTSERSQTFDELILEAVGDYMAELMENTFIPHPKLDLVEELLMEDAWDILRKLTYGYLTLEDFRNGRQKKIRVTN